MSMYCECRVGNNLQHLLTMYFFRESQMVTKLKNQLEKCHSISLKEIDIKVAICTFRFLFLGRYVVQCYRPVAFILYGTKDMAAPQKKN